VGIVLADRRCYLEYSPQLGQTGAALLPLEAQWDRRIQPSPVPEIGAGPLIEAPLAGDAAAGALAHLAPSGVGTHGLDQDGGDLWTRELLRW
jgi:hypothetical protein